jgi:lipopolysaccharide transport system ATP-binding protein
MNDHPIGTVVFDSVSKRYRLGAFGTLRSTISALMRRGRDNDLEEVWALRNVNFHVEPATSVGLIGPNGAGKTTTLKLLSNITRPSQGHIFVQGRVASLIELGAGFHPELTGRENIYLNGAILGLRRREISQRLDNIIAFSGLERFIDTPVKRYSSGMYVRLGFAVAAHLEPDVLLVDEVLAVGDASFRHRCLQHMRNLQRDGTTIIFVSHNMHLVQRMCDKAFLLVDGRIQSSGATQKVVNAYERWRSDSATSGDNRSASYDSQGQLILKALKLSQPGKPDKSDDIDSYRPMIMQIDFHAVQPVHIGRIDVRILREDSTLCCTADSSRLADDDLHRLTGKGTVELTYAPMQLTTGTYTAVVQITDVSDSVVIASAKTLPFYVHAQGASQDYGVYVPQVNWRKA